MAINKLLTPLKNLIAISCIAGVVSTSAVAQNNIYRSIESSAHLRYDPNAMLISNVPEQIRFVPIHPKDTYASPNNNGPIDDSPLNYSPYSLNLEVRYGKTHNYSKWSTKTGVSLEYPIIASAKINERNYTNSPGSSKRGYGAALTYYGLRPDILGGLKSMIPGAYVKAYRTISSGNKSTWKLFGEYDLKYNSNYISTGWDRNDMLQVRKRYVVANTLNNILMLGVDMHDNNKDINNQQNIQFYAGYVLPVSRITPIAKDMNIEIKPHFVFGVSVNGFTNILQDKKK